MLKLRPNMPFGKCSDDIIPSVYVIDVNTGQITHFAAPQISQQSTIPVTYAISDIAAYHQARKSNELA